MNYQECLATKAVPYGHACGQRAEEILTCQNLNVVEAHELAPVGAPSCCVSTGEVAAQRRGLEEVLDSWSGRHEEDCPLLPAVLTIPPPPLIW